MVTNGNIFPEFCGLSLGEFVDLIIAVPSPHLFGALAGNKILMTAESLQKDGPELGFMEHLLPHVSVLACREIKHRNTKVESVR